MIKSFMLLIVAFGAMAAAGCNCHCAKDYPKDTFIGSSGWPASQVPLDHVPH